MVTKKGKDRLRILVWFRKLRGNSTAMADGRDAPVAAKKPMPALVRVLSLPVTKANLRTWVPTVLASHTEKLRRSISSNTPLPLTAKNVAALNASNSFYSRRCSCPAEALKGQALHRAWEDWDAGSSSGMSSLQDGPVAKKDAPPNCPIPEDLQLEVKEAEGAASGSSSPAASQIPAGPAALHTGTTTTEVNSTSTAHEPSERLISHYIDNLTLSQPHGESISRHVHALQDAIDELLQQNEQLRQKLHAHGGEFAAADGASSRGKAVQHAVNAVCADLVKLQLEVRAKDQVIGKLRTQISSVQQMLQVA